MKPTIDELIERIKEESLYYQNKYGNLLYDDSTLDDGLKITLSALESRKAGFMMVPGDPTEEMISIMKECVCEALRNKEISKGQAMGDSVTKNTLRWKEAIAAAPQSPLDVVLEEVLG